MMAVDIAQAGFSQAQDIARLLRRARSEFLEMPGLRLTPVQAARLWAVDRLTSAQLLETLSGSGFLLKDRTGAYLRASVA